MLEHRSCANCAWGMGYDDNIICLHNCREVKGLPTGKVMVEKNKVICDSWNHFSHPFRESAEKQYLASNACGKAFNDRRPCDDMWEGGV